MVKKRRHLSLSTSGETTACQTTLAKGVTVTGCSRFLIGQNTLEKCEQMLTRRWGLSTQRTQLAKAMTFRFGNDETLETRTLAILPVGIAGVNGVLRVYVVPGGAPLLLSKEFSRDLGCHIDLGRGHLFFEKLGVRTGGDKRTVAAFASNLLRSFGPQGHKIPAEIQPRISSDECAIYRATCDRFRTEQNTCVDRLQHLTINHLKLTAPTLNPCMDRMNRRKTQVMKRETTGKTEEEDG